MCKVCKKTRALKFFDKKEVLSLLEIDETQQLVCFDCKDLDDFAAEEFYCTGCMEKKPFREFLAGMRKTITVGKRKSHGLYCGKCQCPPCVVCGKRAAEAVPSGQRHKEYYCETCGWKKNKSNAIHVKLGKH